MLTQIIRPTIEPSRRTGARSFAKGLYEFLHGPGAIERRFERWCDVVANLPRRQTRVSTWPIVTVFGFIAQPDVHIFLKPNVTRTAARAYGFPFHYTSRPSWKTYAGLLEFAGVVQADLADMHPQDMIDIQSFVLMNRAPIVHALKASVTPPTLKPRLSPISARRR